MAKKLTKKPELTKEEIQAFRPYVFDPCTSKEQLHRWIIVVLGLDMPDCIVDPESDSCITDLIWEIYDVALNGKEEDYSHFLLYASRDSFKTLGSAILEVLMMVHGERDVAHMAAIKTQSKKCQSYVKKFLNRPLLREFVTSKNDTQLGLTRFRALNADININEGDWKSLTQQQQDEFVEIRKEDSIVICNLQGANSAHVPFMTVDEIDTVEDVVAYEEAKMIPAPEGDKMPITFYTSTRKFAYGLVQQELDAREKTGLQVRHFNIIDVTRRCEPTRHHPELPRQNLYADLDQLVHVTEDVWQAKPPEDQKRYKLFPDAYAGCAKCPLFTACKGNLATRQTSNSPLLKPIQHTITQLGRVSVANANAQYLCKKPSTTGLIYPALDESVHKLTAAQMAELISGEARPDTFSKPELIKLAIQLGLEFRGGMDFGSAHFFATSVGIKYGQRLLMIHAHEVADLDVVQQNELITWERDTLNPLWWPDMASPGNIKSLKRWGNRLGTWKKKPGSVLEGIEDVRANIRPAIGTPHVFFLKGDDGCDLLFKRLKEYHWMKGSDGQPTNVPDETNDDHPDEFRYLIMNELKTRVDGIKMDASEIPGARPSMVTGEIVPRETHISYLITEALGGNPRLNLETEMPIVQKSKKGGIRWSI